ncbi:DUF6379 domain-containing protein [Novosphingobium sp. PP1Y]|uniref:C-glycoside deglycosidase beta subunit domain-containing protein n=1 Tax=Novosphingobium sp. PP1Y TaxID=702113 RepID=UPI001E54DE96|nr:DUF6379 domain-containing protein [Novosphingobium sp. PP1Y]
MAFGESARESALLPVERVIAENGLHICADGVRIDVRLPWYRSLPLSTIEIEALSIGGTPIDLTSVRFELEGKRWDFHQLAEQTDAFWFVLDQAQLLVPGQTLEPGSEHEVAVTIALYPPYIPGMRRSNSQKLTLKALEGKVQ